MRIVIALLVALSITTAFGCGGTRPTVENPRPPSLRVRAVEVTDHVWQLHAAGGEGVGSGSGSDYYSTLVIGDRGAVVIDPTSDALAEHMVATIRRLAPGAALSAIVYSHWHLDHSTGAAVLRREFGPDVPILAHARAKRRIERWNRERGDDAILPTQTIGDGGLTLDVGGRTIELAYMGHAHTDTMLVLTVQPDSVVYACDFVQNRGVGYSDLPGVDVHEQVAMLYRVLEIDAQHALFCHTPPGDRASVRSYLDYFDTLWRRVAEAIERGLGASDTVAQVTMDEYGDWARADRWLADNVRGMHRWLTAHPDVEKPTGPTPIPDR